MFSSAPHQFTINRFISNKAQIWVVDAEDAFWRVPINRGFYKLFGVEGAMSNSFQRFWMIEHLIGMLIAIVLITIGHSKSKKGADANQKNKAIRTFYLIALIIILLTIPWPFKEGFEGYGWF